MIRVEATAVRADGSRCGPMRLSVGSGERLLVSGASGSGKSTLIRLLSGGLARGGAGAVEGQVLVDGRDPSSLPPAQRPLLLGFVPQDPSDALVAGTVGDEVAFGPRCARLDDVPGRVAEALTRAGVGPSPDRDPRRISTGEQQRVVVAGAIAGRPAVLLLDEPLAHLDPEGAQALLGELGRLADGGVTIVLAEHRLRLAMPWCSRHVELADGVVAADGAPGVPPPEPVAVALAPPGPREVLRVEGLTGGHGGEPVIRDLSLSLREGERLAVVGANGAGKSTLLGLLSGRLEGRPDRERLEIPTDPDLTLFCATVREELAYGPSDRGVPTAEVARRVARVAQALRLSPLLDRAPHATSRGERLRIAVGAALCTEPRVLLLDEPTAGQDEAAVEALFAGLRALPGCAVVFATHDRGVARRHAHRVLSLP